MACPVFIWTPSHKRRFCDVEGPHTKHHFPAVEGARASAVPAADSATPSTIRAEDEVPHPPVDRLHAEIAAAPDPDDFRTLKGFAEKYRRWLLRVAASLPPRNVDGGPVGHSAPEAPAQGRSRAESPAPVPAGGPAVPNPVDRVCPRCGTTIDPAAVDADTFPTRAQVES